MRILYFHGIVRLHLLLPVSNHFHVVHRKSPAIIANGVANLSFPCVAADQSQFPHVCVHRFFTLNQFWMGYTFVPYGFHGCNVEHSPFRDVCSLHNIPVLGAFAGYGKGGPPICPVPGQCGGNSLPGREAGTASRERFAVCNQGAVFPVHGKLIPL